MCAQFWLRSDGRVEKGGGYRQTDKGTLQLYIVDSSLPILQRLATETLTHPGNLGTFNMLFLTKSENYSEKIRTKKPLRNF